MRSVSLSFLMVIGLLIFSTSFSNAMVLQPLQEASAGKESAILDAYLVLKDALVATDAEQAKAGAKQLLKATAGMEGEMIEAVRKDAEYIAASDDIAEQRKHFSTLSDNVLMVIKGADGIGQNVYRQYCPMAMQNNGAHWLSTTEEIRNPYFGKMMLKCGKTVEIIE